MKKILLVLPSFTHGGTIRVAQSLVELIDKNKYDVHICALQHNGDLKSLFKDCFILNENINLSVNISLSSVLKRVSFVKKILAVLFYMFGKVFYRNKHNLYAKVGRKIQKKYNYDVIIAFQEGITTEVVSSFENVRKIAWIHCDYSRYKSLTNKDEFEIYNKFEKIVCVSTFTKKAFDKEIPNLSHKSCAIHNLMDSNYIINKSLETNPNNEELFDCFSIVSVGRMDPVKQFNLIPKIASKIKENGLKFKWFIIGDGGIEKDIIKEEIEKFNLEDTVIMVGALENPYNYMVNSDLLVCLSSSEACPNVINEARILHIPILTNNFGSVNEYVENNFNGIIIENNEMADYIVKLITDNSIIASIKDNINEFVYENDYIIKQICELMEP